MRWRICTIGGIDIQVHVSILVYLAYAVLMGHLIMIVIALISILLHEAAHATVSSCLGQKPRCLEITALGAVMRIEDEAALMPLRRMLVLLAGPSATLLLCWMAVIGTDHGWISMEIGRLIFTTNFCILVLNSLPVLPLDGGRLLILLLDMFLPKHAVAHIARYIGYTFGITLIGLNLYYCWSNGGLNFSLAFAGSCMIYCAAVSVTTWAMTEMRFFLERKIRLERQGSLRCVIISCLHTTEIRQVIKKLPPSRHALFWCLEAGRMRHLGLVDENVLIQHYLQHPQHAVADCLRTVNIGMKWDQYDTK